MQWNYLDLMAAERQRDMLADSERVPHARTAERVPLAPAGLRALIWSVGHGLTALGRKLERAAGPSDESPHSNERTGAFV